MKHLFYLWEPGLKKASPLPIPDGYEVELWRPRLTHIKPADLPWVPFAVWWLFHIVQIFVNPHYALLLIRREGRLVHRSCIFPGYMRFPFMASDDLQVGDTWTASDERGRGLASSALNRIISQYAGATRVWYVTEAENMASIRVPEKCGFRLFADGERRKRFGLTILGDFVINSNHFERSSESSRDQG